MPETLRDQLAAALRIRLSAVHCPRGVLRPEEAVDYIGLTEFDLADAALAVVQAELGRLIADRDAALEGMAEWRASACRIMAERDRAMAGVPLVCADDRHQAKVRGLEAEIERLTAVLDAAPTPAAEADTCQVVEVDGQPIAVRGSGDLTGRDHEMFAEVVRAAQRRYATENPNGAAERPEVKCNIVRPHPNHLWLRSRQPVRCPGAGEQP